MAFKFPFTNYHELNLTWVLDQLKKLFEESAENVSVIETYNGRLTAVETELPTVSENAAEAARSAAAAATLAQTAKATADTAQENAIQAQRTAGTAQNTAERAQEAADAATQAAQQAQATAQNFDGRITQAENDASQALEASRSFENRVQAASTTANNAARTATDAQGVAQNANQNAAAALDKIGDLSALDTTAKQNLVVAINEALENGGQVDSVNGKTGVVVLDAGDIGYNGSTVESALDGKQNAPAAAGTVGQVLGLDAELNPIWLNQSGGGECSNCAPAIITTKSSNISPLSIADGADNRLFSNIIYGVQYKKENDSTPNIDNPVYCDELSAVEIIVNNVSYNIDFSEYATNLFYFTYDLITGQLINNGNKRVFTGNENFLMQTTGARRRFERRFTNMGQWTEGISCYFSHFVQQYNGARTAHLSASGYVSFYDDTEPYRWETAAYFNAWVAEQYQLGTPVTLYYRRNIPLSYNLPSHNIDTVYLANTIESLTAFSSLYAKYHADTKAYIDNKIAELQALVLENNG